MVEFTEYMSIGLNQCASGEPNEERKRIFSELVDLWNTRKEDIRSMSASELKSELNCP